MNNDWIIWNGGDCPVPSDTMVQVQLRTDTRNSAEFRDWREAKSWDWAVDGRNLDIIAYRITSEPMWVGITGFVGYEGYFAFGREKCIDDTHRLRIPVKLINGKRVIDDSRQPIMEKL